MIKISSPEQQLRQNRAMLLLIGGVSSLGGLLIWSAPPFALNDSKNPVHVSLRYIALVSGLVCGVSAVACGHQLEKISPLIEAIDAAEKRDFLTQLAVACHVQETQHRSAAMQSLSPTASESGNAGNGTGNKPVTDHPEPLPAVTKSESYQGVTAESAESESPESPESDPALAASFKPYYLAVLSARAMGESDSKIIKEILGQEGRNFEKGKQMLANLLVLGQQQNW